MVQLDALAASLDSEVRREMFSAYSKDDPDFTNDATSPAAADGHRWKLSPLFGSSQHLLSATPVSAWLRSFATKLLAFSHARGLQLGDEIDSLSPKAYHPSIDHGPPSAAFHVATMVGTYQDYWRAPLPCTHLSGTCNQRDRGGH